MFKIDVHFQTSGNKRADTASSVSPKRTAPNSAAPAENCNVTRDLRIMPPVKYWPGGKKTVPPPAAAQAAPVLRKPYSAPARVPSALRSAVAVSPSESNEEDFSSAARTAAIPSAVAEEDDPNVVYSMEELEIPAFLRRRMHRAEPQDATRAFHGAA